ARCGSPASGIPCARASRVTSATRQRKGQRTSSSYTSLRGLNHSRSLWAASARRKSKASGRKPGKGGKSIVWKLIRVNGNDAVHVTPSALTRARHQHLAPRLGRHGAAVRPGQVGHEAGSGAKGLLVDREAGRMEAVYDAFLAIARPD